MFYILIRKKKLQMLQFFLFIGCFLLIPNLATRRIAYAFDKVTRIIRACLKAAYFGAFHLFLFDRRQPICIKDNAKIPRNLLALRSKILKRADFCSTKA